jgi:hypothetical protein
MHTNLNKPCLAILANGKAVKRWDTVERANMECHFIINHRCKVDKVQYKCTDMKNTTNLLLVVLARKHV